MDVNFASIKFGFILPTINHSVEANQILAYWNKINRILTELSEAHKEGVFTNFKLTPSYPGYKFQRFSSRFNDKYQKIEGGFVIENGPLIGEFFVYVPDKEGVHSFPLLMHQKERDSYEKKIRKLHQEAVEKISGVLVNIFQKIVVPDIFGDGQDYEDILIRIHPEIQKLGKEIDGITLIVSDKEKCDYPLGKSPRFQ